MPDDMCGKAARSRRLRTYGAFMSSEALSVGLPAVIALVALMTLTALGARRRGRSVASSVLAGVFFPVAWTVWYLRDEHPYDRTVRRP